MKIIGMSDSHNRHNKYPSLPACDVFIHAGDWSGQGLESETRNFAKWLNKQPAKHKIIVPGNHEKEFEYYLPLSRNWILEECPDAIILIEEQVVIDGIKFYGSPITPWFYNWAWNRARGDKSDTFYYNGKMGTRPAIKPHWDAIPDDTNVLITHGPPYGILDELHYVDGTPKGEFVGCDDLMNRIKEVKPDLHLFGHIHYHGGQQKHVDGTSFYNISLCDETYSPTNGFTVIEYEKN